MKTFSKVIEACMVVNFIVPGTTSSLFGYFQGGLDKKV